MKNVQFIDGANNCSYSIFSISDTDYKIIFSETKDVEFIEDLTQRIGEEAVAIIIKSTWNKELKKQEVQGIHGTLFFGLLSKKKFYPNKLESDLKDSRIQGRAR